MSNQNIEWIKLTRKTFGLNLAQIKKLYDKLRHYKEISDVVDGVITSEPESED